QTDSPRNRGGFLKDFVVHPSLLACDNQRHVRVIVRYLFEGPDEDRNSFAGLEYPDEADVLPGSKVVTRTELFDLCFRQGLKFAICGQRNSCQLVRRDMEATNRVALGTVGYGDNLRRSACAQPDH